MPDASRLSDDDFAAWLGHPVTEAVLKYLKDLADAQREDWSRGHGWTEEAKIRVQNLEDLSEIDLESMRTFYDARERARFGVDDQ